MSAGQAWALHLGQTRRGNSSDQVLVYAEKNTENGAKRNGILVRMFYKTIGPVRWGEGGRITEFSGGCYLAL